MGTGGLPPSGTSSTPTITPSSTAAAFLLPPPPKSGGGDGLQILGGLSPIPPPATVSDSQPSRIGGRDVASAGSSPSHSPEQYSSDSAQDFPPAVPLRGVREQDGGRFPLRSSGLWEAVDRRGSRDDEDSDEVGKVLRPASLEVGRDFFLSAPSLVLFGLAVTPESAILIMCSVTVCAHSLG